MSELTVFEFEKKDIRTIMIDGCPWWVAKDVCDVLGLTNHSIVMDRLDEDEKLNKPDLSSLGQRGGWLINESGLYSIILKSDKPEAKRMKRWITHDVLPSIRKHGVYSIDKSELMTKQEAMRLVEKSAFKSMTDSIKAHGENDRMHGFAYSSYNNLIYKMILGKDSKALKSELNIKKGQTVKDFLDPDKLKQVENAERLVDAMLRIGKQFMEIKAELEKLLTVKIAG